MTREEFEELICDKLGMFTNGSVETLAEELERLFNEKSLPSAEGAEEMAKQIWNKHHKADFDKDVPEEMQTSAWFCLPTVVAAMQDFATLHAQKMAEKMVEERLIEFGNMIRDEPNGDIPALADYFMRTINLKSKEQ